MYARIEDITKSDIPQSDSLSNYDGLKIVKEIVEYETVEGHYHPSIDWIEIQPESGISYKQTYDPQSDTFGPEPSLPSFSISLSNSQIINDGSDSVTITITVSGFRSWDPESWDGVLEIDGDQFSETFSATSETTETVTTTASAGTFIEVKAESDGIKDAFAEIEVTN